MSSARNTGAGLDRLQSLAVVKIHQTYNWGNNKYKVNTVDGDLLFTMKENSNWLELLSGGSSRGFFMDSVDGQGTKVFMIRRPTPCCSDKVEVTMGGQVVCEVHKEFTCMTPLFTIYDGNDIPMLRVKGNWTQYKFKTPSKATIGSISKKFRGLFDELFTYADDYEIKFPEDLSLPNKVATIATCILIDYNYHER